jgi:Zn-dependent peptidase ImmA (M78 family)
MPKSEIASELIGLNLQRAASLKPYWRVSMAALIRRARTLKKITEVQYRQMFIRLGELGYRRKEPFSIDPEEATIFPRMIDAYLHEGAFTVADLATLLCWPDDELVKKYLPVSDLRLAQ